MGAMYKGFYATLHREFWSMAAYFGLYESLKQKWIHDNDPHRQIKTFLAGGSAGMAAQLICLPFDAVKVRLQTQIQVQTTLGCMKRLYLTEGVSGFFRGLTPVIMRAFPANGATFLTFEFMLNTLG